MSLLAFYIGELRGFRAYALAFLTGTLSVMTFAPFHFLFLLPVCLCVLVWQLDGCRTVRYTFAIAWMFSAGFYGVGLHWMGHAFFVSGMEDAYYVLPLAGYLLVLLPLFFVCACVLARRFLWGEGLPRLLAFAAALTLADWCRGHFMADGLPWNMWGNTLTASLPWAQAASLVGVYGLSLASVAIALVPALFGDGRREARMADKRTRLFVPCAALVLAVAAWLWGAHRIDSAPEHEGIAVRIVQPKFNQRDKVERNDLDGMGNVMLRLSFRPEGYENSPDPDVIIWPEVAIPVTIKNEDVLREYLAKYMPSGSYLVAGSYRYDDDPSSLWSYNSLVVLNDEAEVVEHYDKQHLVPFGEYVPYAAFFEKTGLTALTGEGGFGIGEGSRVLELGNLPDAGALICFEIIFSGEVVTPGERPDWLVVASNDAWFGDSIGPWQHLDQAVVRAIEEGLPIARSTNTGVSALIDTRGRILAKLGIGERGVLDVRLPPPTPPTVFSRVGDVPMFAGAFLLLLLSMWSKFRKKASA